MTTQLFAVEHYDQTGGEGSAEGSMPPLPAGITSPGAIYLPVDQVVIALVEGDDAPSVLAALDAAGWRPDRITPATWITVAAVHPTAVNQRLQS